MIFPVIVAFVIFVSMLSSHAQTTTDFLLLLEAEDLELISLHDPVTFAMADGTYHVAPAGVYRVAKTQQKFLQLTQREGKDSFLIPAENTHHDDKIPSAIALFAVDDKDFAHVVLLFPDGKGLEAVGSFRRAQFRAVIPLLSASQLHEALIRKKTASGDRAQPPATK